MRVFITGGAGYVGCHCARLLRQAGHQLRIYDNLTTGHARAVPAEELVVGDVGQGDPLRAAMEAFRPDAVMHFAASTAVGESVQHPLKYYRNNVVNTIVLLETMRALNVRKLVFSSSCAVYGVPPATPIREEMPCRPMSPYGRTKRMMEQVLADCRAAWGLGYAALRYFNAAGAASDGSLGEDHNPETHLIPVILQVVLGQRDCLEIFGDDYETPDGTCIRDYIHVDDLAAAHRAALEALGDAEERIYNLGTGRGHSVREVLQAVEKVTGRPVPVRMGPRRAGDSPILFADPSRIKADLGWQAEITDIEQIVASAWRWRQAHPNGYQ